LLSLVVPAIVNIHEHAYTLDVNIHVKEHYRCQGSLIAEVLDWEIEYLIMILLMIIITVIIEAVEMFKCSTTDFR
jgi:hypothetical protein